MMIIKGFWICFLGLQLSLAKDLYHNSSPNASEDNSLGVHLKDSSLKSDLEDILLGRNPEDVAFIKNYGGGISDFGDRLNTDEEDDEYGKGVETYERDNHDIIKKYRTPAVIGKLHTAGDKTDRNTNLRLAKSEMLGDYGDLPVPGNEPFPWKPGSEIAPFTAEDHKKMLDLHTLYRENYTYPSGNTEFMVTNQELAESAQDVAYKCEVKYTPGQNMYVGTSGDPSTAAREWYREHKDFDFLTWKCSGKDCSHVTQMLWAMSKNLGCARHYCWPKEKKFIIVCLYDPPGNLEHNGELLRGYIIGKACTLCLMEQGGYCMKNQCVHKDVCDQNPENCKCGLHKKDCKNCGVWNEANCRCDCKNGWDYLDCSLPCENMHDECGNQPDTACEDLVNKNRFCREKCSKCTTVEITPNMDNSSVCCDGAGCPAGKSLLPLTKMCYCEKYCPSIHCYTPKSSTSGSGSLGCTTRARCFGVLILFVLGAFRR